MFIILLSVLEELEKQGMQSHPLANIFWEKFIRFGQILLD